MFESDFIDFFSRVPWFIVPAIYVPLISVFVAFAAVNLGVSLPLVAAQFALGVVVWSLMEYWLHRTLFHWVPDTWWGDRFHFILHGVHHTWVDDRFRLVMPPAASLGLAVVFFSGFWMLQLAGASVLGDTWVWSFFAGVMAGYLAYDMIHYYVHHGRPTSKMMRALRAHHLAHHHNPKYQEAKFGVSSTVWDHVFGTYS